MLVVNNLLRKLQINWKFNLSRSPWCGGFYERMVGIAKKVVYKTSGREELSFSAPKEVVLEAKVILTPIKLGILKIAFSSFVEGGSI